MTEQVQRILGIGAIAALPTLLASAGNPRRALLVADDATWQAAGLQVQAQLTHAIDHTDLCGVGRQPEASLALATKIVDAAKACDVLIAIGAGTVNDLTKYAAHQMNKPYIAVATAASMNGYSSSSASLKVEGEKHSFAARAPLAVIADSSVLSAAPPALARAGLGDTLCRSAVEADMLLSHHVLGTPYPRALFDRLRSHEAALIEGADAIRAGEPTSIEKLMNALLDAGDAMRLHGSSAVASQGEHMIAHRLEVLAPRTCAALLHGEMIAITSLTMCALQHQLLQARWQLTPVSYPATAPANLALKSISTAKAATLNAHIAAHWPGIRASFAEIMRPEAQLRAALTAAGLKTTPQEAGIAAEDYAAACKTAHTTRDRFTFLDLANAMQCIH